MQPFPDARSGLSVSTYRLDFGPNPRPRYFITTSEWLYPTNRTTYSRNIRSRNRAAHALWKYAG